MSSNAARLASMSKTVSLGDAHGERARWFIFDALIDATIPPGDPYPDPYAPDDPCPAFPVNDETALVNPPALGVANDPDALVLG